MANRIYQAKAKVIKNVEVIKNCYKISLYCPQIAGVAKPGQFAQVKVSEAFEPLLRRPLSIHRVAGPNNIEFLYEVVGRGTEILANRETGESLDIIGPLGSSFNYEPRTTNHEARILVAGGIGVAPLMFLAERLIKRSTNHEARTTTILIGARTKKRILYEGEFKKLGCEVRIATDDGSKGSKGKVTDLLNEVLRTTKHEPRTTTIYACGPRPMLREISRLSIQYNLAAQISLEEHMACGIGVCLGCVVDTKLGYKRVCKEGPVFNADEINW